MWKRLGEIAARQAGIVAVWQAVACGIPRSSVFRRARADGWRRVAAGSYLLPGHLLTPRARLWAAIAAASRPVSAGDRGSTPRAAAVTGHAAAWLHGIRDSPPAVLEVVIDHRQRAPRVPGVRVIRSRTIREEDLTTRAGLPCVSVPRIGIDLAPRAGAAELRGLLIDMRQRRQNLGAVASRALDATPFPGRRRYLAVLAQIASDNVESEFARLVGTWLRGLGFAVESEHPIQTPGRLVHADLALVPFKIAIECDGFGAHSSRRQLSSDARRANGLALRDDWIVLRITWDRWEHDRDGFLAELHAAIDLRRSTPTSA